jgi:hypothetical protein
MLLVWVNLTLTCQGHDVGQHHSGVHIALFGDHDEAEQPGQSAQEQEIGHGTAQPANVATERAMSTAASDETELSVMRTCLVGPLSGSPEGGDIITTGAGDTMGTPARIPPFSVYDAPGEMLLVKQAFALPEKPPPRASI